MLPCSFTPWLQESFEEQQFSSTQARRPATGPLGLPSAAWIQSSVNAQLYIRHCDYILWQTMQIAPAVCCSTPVP